jgi:hypothetical protein
MSADEIGWPVVMAPVKARLVETPRMAPDSMPRMNRLRGATPSLVVPASIIASATAAGFP